MNANNTTSVKLNTSLVQEVAKHKEKTGLPIATFINRATEEKLKRIKAKKKA